MRRQKIGLTVFLTMTIMLMMVLPVRAAGSASFSLAASSGTVRIGDTVTITGRISASSMVATFDLDVRYNAGQLKYIKAEPLAPIQSGEIDFGVSAGSIQVLYLDNDGGASGVTSGNLFRLTFQVSGGQPGDSIQLSYSIRTAGDASAAAMSTSGSGVNLAIAAPLSTNNNLAALTVSPGSLTPAFSPAVTQYSLSVPYEINKIDVRAAAADGTAKVAVNSPGLAAGGQTTLTVKVTAASGAEKTYLIRVSRAQDPNYKPSSNANLGSLSVEGFLLSPAFNPDRDAYAIYLPYEIEQVNVLAGAADSKAKIVGIKGQDNLTAGTINVIEVVVQAEDESTAIYRIAAVRANRFDGLENPGLAGSSTLLTPSPTPAPTPTRAPAAPTESAVSSTSAMSDTAPDLADDSTDSSGISLPWLLVIVLATALAGAVAAIIWLSLERQKSKKWPDSRSPAQREIDE